MSLTEVVSTSLNGKQEWKASANKDKETTGFIGKLRNFVVRQILPIGTLVSLIFGVFVPQPAVYLSERIPLTKICIVGVFFFVGLRLRSHEAKSAFTSYKEVLIGLLWVLFVGPVLRTKILSQIHQFGPLIGGQWDLKNNTNGTNEDIQMPVLGPQEFHLALQIYCMCPNAPATALIMVTAANGHRGLSILVSVLCTIISVFTVPLLMLWLLPTLQQIRINVGEVQLNAVLWILLPLLIGQGSRRLSPVKEVVKKWEDTVKYTEVCFIIAIFLAKVSETSASGNMEKVSVVNIICTVALGSGLTTFNLIASYGILSVLPWFSHKSTVTLSILSSIPLVVMAATIVDVLPDGAGDKGLLTVPAIFVYLTTLLVLNCFVVFARINEDVTDTKSVKAEDLKDSCVDPKGNYIAVFTIYTDEIFPIKTLHLNERGDIWRSPVTPL